MVFVAIQIFTRTAPTAPTAPTTEPTLTHTPDHEPARRVLFSDDVEEMPVDGPPAAGPEGSGGAQGSAAPPPPPPGTVLIPQPAQGQVAIVDDTGADGVVMTPPKETISASSSLERWAQLPGDNARSKFLRKIFGGVGREALDEWRSLEGLRD